MPKPLWAPWRLEYVQQADEATGCIFCAPEEELVLHRGELAFALLNRFPYASGHLMVAPVRHVGEHRHEVRVARPPRHDVEVHVVYDSRARDAAEVPAEVVPMG